LKKLIIILFGLIASYYSAIILHEWGHGTVAWAFGYKPTPFAVQYGGWFLLNVDENVPYHQILSAGRGPVAALIGIAGVSVSIFLFLLSLAVLRKIKNHLYLYSFFYWLLILDMVPIVQYLVVQPFSLAGDTGQFVQGLNISPWLVFAPGLVLTVLGLYRIFRYEVPKAYAFFSIQALWAQCIFLLLTLYVLFLFLYSHNYNPLSDQGMPLIGTIFAYIQIALVPILFAFCNPSREWVRREIAKNKR
jgi:hypothetical protein